MLLRSRSSGWRISTLHAKPSWRFSVSRVILITGGVRSGKSRFALEVASRWKRKAFLATAEPLDEEMAERISRHRKERGREFFTVEEPLEVCRALLAIPDEFDCVLFECLATWLGNVLVREGVEALEGRSEELLRTVEGLRKNLI
ncbi:MAG: hypothetical protein D6713_01500, partial [Deltaproteobacteria bacterium]